MNGRVRTGLIAILLLAPTVTGAFQPYQVYGAIAAKWHQFQTELGMPRSSEADDSRGGRFNEFQYGFVYYHPNLCPPPPERSCAHAVFGLIGERWNALGRERWGYPYTDEIRGPRGGRWNDFEHNATIAWHPPEPGRPDRAYLVYGAIRREWVAHGRESGPCGYPVSEEHDDHGNRRSDFEHGYYIQWNPRDGRTSAHCVSYTY